MTTKNWQERHVGEVLEFRSGNLDPRVFPDEVFDYYSMPAYDSQHTPDIAKGAEIGSSKKLVFPGDVLFARLNPRIPRVWIVEESQNHYRSVASTDFVSLVDRRRTDGSLWFDPAFLRYQLLSDNFRSQVTKNVQGATGSRQRIRPEALEAAKLQIPSLKEQRRIVARIEALLGEVREMRKLQGQIESDTGKLIEAVLAENFASEASSSWTGNARLGNLAEITARQVDPTLSTYKDLPHIYGATIEGGTGRLLQYRSAAEDGMRSAKYRFEPGAVLYSKIRPYLRKAALADFEGLCSADMYPLRLKTDDVLPEFLLWTLLSPAFTSYANSLSGRARIPKLNREQLFGYEMHYPTIEVQERICKVLKLARDEVTEMQALSNSSAELLGRLEQAILSQAFRGEL